LPKAYLLIPFGEDVIIIPEFGIIFDTNMDFKNKTAFITGASRGIGKSIAMALAKQGANIIVAAKTTEPHPKLEGTIYSAAEDLIAAGGQALPVICDIRNEENVLAAVKQGAEHFGGIDICINNASAISLTPVQSTDAKRFDLMHQINIRGTFLVSKACIPYLEKSASAHILTLSPPLNLDKKWLGAHAVYTVSKYGMSMIALGLAEELKSKKIASNCLWPQTTIATAAVQNLLGGDALIAMSRKPEIVADAAIAILKQNPESCTGNSFIDEQVLATAGITNLEQYAITPGGKLFNDIFL
jgi:citronellol/citronellal dehydrogenase